MEHEWALGTRLGTSADGPASQWPKTPPSSLRKDSLWEAIPVLAYPGLVGYPPTVYANSVMRRQSAFVAFKHREAAESLLVLAAGRGPKDNDSSKESLAQRANSGHCPCCVAPTHISAPPSYTVGGWDGPKARGARHRGRHGPSAGRPLAAAHVGGAQFMYIGFSGSSHSWGWSGGGVVEQKKCFFSFALYRGLRVVFSPFFRFCPLSFACTPVCCPENDLPGTFFFARPIANSPCLTCLVAPPDMCTCTPKVRKVVLPF